MNKSYRSIYNESLAAWVAVSELDSAHGKASSGGSGGLVTGGRGLSMALTGIAAGVLMALSSPAWANMSNTTAAAITANADNGIVASTNSIAISSNTGNAARALGNASIAIGYDANATSQASIAIGLATFAGSNSVAMGENANAFGAKGLAFGLGSRAVQANDTAIGQSANANGGNSVALAGC